MAVWNDLSRGHAAEFDAWYRRQHIPERLRQPGFLEARRYIAHRGSPRYCAFYWLESISALATPSYLARLAQPTRWTKRVMPWFRNMGRSPCTVTLDQGSGLGGMMTWIASFADAGQACAPRTRLETVFRACCDDPAIARMQLWECDANSRKQSNPEQRLRVGRDQVADWIVVIEGASEAALSASARRVVAALGKTQSRNRFESPCYRLMWRMCVAEAPAPCSDEDVAASG